jgi:uncharacterized protein YdbL (DUF1318 family)
MNIRNMTKIIVLLIVSLIVSSQYVFAAGIKERMKQRLPVIKGLKAKGIIGEDNKGYLGFVSGNKVQQDVIAAENKDRKLIYNHIAKQQNTTIDTVEKKQAKRKADKAKSGQFFQNGKGEWIKK